eukprot:637430-Prymnesium_polylepis.1
MRARQNLRFAKLWQHARNSREPGGTTTMASAPSASFGLAVFTLVRGGPNESDLETFVNSRICLDK